MPEEYSIPKHQLTPEQKKAADEELKILRFKRLEELTESAKTYSELLRLKYEIMDYLELLIYDEKHSFGSYLKKYVQIFQIKRKELADNLSIHETKFSRLINDKDDPGLNVLFRLEEHSNGVLQADMLWNLVTRKIQDQIRRNKKDRLKESKLVKNKFAYKR